MPSETLVLNDTEERQLDDTPRVSKVQDHVGPATIRLQTGLRSVAFIAGGKGKHRTAAQERAVSLAENSEVNFTPLQDATENIWRNRYDLVITGSDEPWGLRDLLLGNAEQRLVRRCPSPLWIVRDRPGPPSRRILVAIDPDPMDRRRTLLSAKLLQAASMVAAWDRSELHVVNVGWSLADYVLALRAGLTIIQGAELEDQFRLEQRRVVYRFFEEFDIHPASMHVHLLLGNATKSIATLVSRLDADLLVMGSFGRRGMSELLIGNTAEKVMRQVACSCLVIKPEGFPHSRRISNHEMP